MRNISIIILICLSFYTHLKGMETQEAQSSPPENFKKFTIQVPLNIENYDKKQLSSPDSHKGTTEEEEEEEDNKFPEKHDIQRIKIVLNKTTFIQTFNPMAFGFFEDQTETENFFDLAYDYIKKIKPLKKNLEVFPYNQTLYVLCKQQKTFKKVKADPRLKSRGFRPES